MNAVFALILLIFTIVTCTIALLHKNPDVRYQTVKDDRTAFMTFETKNQDDDVELAALGATAMAGQDRSSYGNNEKTMLTTEQYKNNLDSKSHLEPYNPNFSKDSGLGNYRTDRVNPFENDDEISYNGSSTSDSYDRQNPFGNGNATRSGDEPRRYL
ncbi:unnamed protein product [Pichia kudriavzevii]